MLETHPFGNFVPPLAKYLILGSFTGKLVARNDWFYSTPRNQFWKILETIYRTDVKTKVQKIELLTKHQIAMADIIYSCERSKNSNLDINLINITYNFKGLDKILKNNKIKQIFFTSKFVENKYRIKFKSLISYYPRIKLSVLPSPSPRYAKLSIEEKTKIYKNLLPF